MMEYWNRVSSYVFRKPDIVKPEPEEEMSKFDGFLNFVCKVVCWEDVTLTWISFLVINLLYALIIYYETRFYCIVFSMAAAFVVLDYYDETIKFKNLSLKRYLYLKDITNGCSTFMYNMHIWKRDNPSFFCGVTTTFFLTLSFIGRTISGRALAYLCILAIYFGPALIKLAPKEVQKHVLQFIKTCRSSEIVPENELIPLITETFDDDNNDETKTQDSFTSSLISGISSMPSHLDPDSEPKELEEDDLIPENRSRLQTAMDYSSDSDSDMPDGMHFDSQHFIRDTSSTSCSDDEPFSDGMKFTDVQDMSGPLVPSTQSFGVTMVSSLATAGSNLLSNLHANFTSQYSKTTPEKEPSSSNPKQNLRRDSSESDFEMIDKDDAVGS